jgi:hypothetical protein
MQMMPKLSDSSIQWVIYARIIVVRIIGLISLYMILFERKEMNHSFEKVRKVVDSVV